MDDMLGIGSRLREERTRLGPNQTDFGAALGVAKNSQYAYEKGERAPDVLYLLKARQLGVDIWYVMTGERMPPLEEGLSPMEANLLSYFRGMSDFKRESLHRVAYAMSAVEGSIDSGKS